MAFVYSFFKKSYGVTNHKLNLLDLSGLGLLIFFVKGMSWLIYDLFIEKLFIDIIGFHLVCYYTSLYEPIWSTYVSFLLT